MVWDNLKVVVKTPAEQSPVSRGFYQVEEDSLYIPVLPYRKFYSYLDSSQAILDIDRKGRLLFIQVLVPRRNWTISEANHPPAGWDTADIRFLDFREDLPKARLETDRDHSWLRLVFADGEKTQSYRAADNLIFEITPSSTLASIWITAIEDDRAAQTMAAWRRMMKELKIQSSDRFALNTG